MNKIEKFFLVTYLVLVINLSAISNSKALIPPDIIASIGSQLGFIFAVTFAAISAFVASIYQYIKIFASHIKIPRWAWIVVLILVLAISFAIAYLVNKMQMS